MSLLKSIAYAFGFGSGSHDDSFDDEPSALVHPLRKETDTPDTPEEVNQPQPLPDVTPKQEEHAIPMSLFDGLLEIFNSSQPDFIKNCLDREAQRRYLYDKLDQSWKDYMGACEIRLRKEADNRVESLSTRLNTELDALRSRCKELDEKEKTRKEQQLSADRQKRALNEKIADMEKNMRTIQAEREQLELENRSLINKIKAASVRSSDSEHDDIEKTRAAMSNKMITELRNNNAHLNQDLEAVKKELEDTKRTLEQSQAAIDKATKDLTDKENEVQDYKQRIEHLNQELSDASSALEAMTQIQEKVEQFEKILTKRDEKIKTLKKEKEQLEESLATLQNDNTALRKRVEEVVTAQSESEKDLRKTIEELQNAEKAPVAEEKPKRKKKTYKISAIDDTLDSTHWLVATPPEGTVVKAASTVADNEFGYQAPQRKPEPENDAQMTLF